MMNFVLGELELGLILAPLALGVFISYRIARFLDITTDGAYVLGAAVAFRLISSGVEAGLATAAATLCGALAGMCTGLVISVLRVRNVLAGILVMTALYGVNLRILSGHAPHFGSESTLFTYASRIAETSIGASELRILGGIDAIQLMTMLLSLCIALVLLGALLFFFRTHLGLALRGAGENASAMKSMGANVRMLTLLALVFANALVALSGAMYAQKLKVVGIGDGIGQIVTGLACVMIGIALFRKRGFAMQLIGAIFGAILYRLVIAAIILSGMFGEDLKIATAVIVLAIIAIPTLLRRRDEGSETSIRGWD